MHQRALSAQVQQLKKELEDVENKLHGEALPLPLLEEFKGAVDHIRSTVWAAISSKGDPYAVGSALVRLRMKRASDMCHQIILDIDAHEITVDSPGLAGLKEALAATQERIQRLHSTRM